MASIQPQPLQTDTKKKSRLSNLFKKDKGNDNDATFTHEPMNPHANAPPHHNDADLLAPDSAYGGSEVGNSTSSSRENVPTITKSDAVRQNMPTKQQFDTASGRVITTTTTTTTTTVTTLGGDHRNVPAGTEVVVTKDETLTPQEMSARPLSKEIQEEDLGEHGHSPQYQGGSSGVGSGMGGHSPPIPVKDGRRRSKSPNTMAMGQGHHARRLSGDRLDGPASPGGHHNFSYPARTPPPQGAYGAVSPLAAGQQHGRFSYEDVPVPPVPGNAQGNRAPTIPRVPLNPPLGAQDPNQGLYQPYRQESAVPQNSSRPRPPMEPSHGQPGLNGQPAREQLPYNRDERPQSTLQSLKFAAAGIHGAGETLRGALNSNLDRRTGASEDRLAKHNAVMERGRQEIETGHFQRASNSTLNSVSEPDELVQTQTQEKKSRGLRNVLRKKSRDRDGLGAVQE